MEASEILLVTTSWSPSPRTIPTCQPTCQLGKEMREKREARGPSKSQSMDYDKSARAPGCTPVPLSKEAMCSVVNSSLGPWSQPLLPATGNRLTPVNSCPFWNSHYLQGQRTYSVFPTSRTHMGSRQTHFQCRAPDSTPPRGHSK